MLRNLSQVSFESVQDSGLLKIIMISNERPSPFSRHPYPAQRYGYGAQNHHPQNGQPPRPPINEETLKKAELQVERKLFIVTLKENPRGRLLRITEEVGGRRNSIIIPATGLMEFKKLLDEMVMFSEKTAMKSLSDTAKLLTS